MGSAHQEIIDGASAQGAEWTDGILGAVFASTDRFFLPVEGGAPGVPLGLCVGPMDIGVGAGVCELPGPPGYVFFPGHNVFTAVAAGGGL